MADDLVSVPYDEEYVGIKLHYSLEVAHDILHRLMGDPRAVLLVDKSKYGRARVETFDNGREQGYKVFQHGSGPATWGKTRCITFAQQRNSDQIVVYSTEKYSLGANEVLPKDMWKNARYFDGLERDKAVDYIFEWLLKCEDDGK